MSENFGDSQCYTFEGTEDCLFIILFRNPYDWVRSLHRTPWHGHESFKKSTLDEFITTTWLLNNQKQTNLIRLKNPLMDLNPETGKEFDNILKLRTAKIKNMLLIQKKAENFYYVNYEKIRDNPKEVLDEIASLFNFSLDFTFQPIVYFKGKPEQGLFSKKIDLQLKKSTLDLINSQLDWEVETTIGYQRINEPEQT